MQQKSFFKTEAVGNDYNLFTHLFIQQILYFLLISVTSWALRMQKVTKILKEISTLLTMFCIVKAVVFTVVTYRCENWTKEDWTLKSWCFQIVVLEETLESPLDSKEMKPLNRKGNQPLIFIGRTDAEAPIFWHEMPRDNSLEKTLMPGKTEVKRRKG